MKKKTILFLLSLTVITLTAIITSCSSDFSEEGMESYSIRQKHEIENLAKEYGLNIELKDYPVTRSTSLDDIEEEFRKMSSFFGEYDIICNQQENGLFLQAYDPIVLFPSLIPNSSAENGSGLISNSIRENYQQNNVNNFYEFFITVQVNWNLVIHQNVSIESVNVKEMQSFEDVPVTVQDKFAILTGNSPGTIDFSCFIQLSGDYADYSYHLVGSYPISSGIGTLQII